MNEPINQSTMRLALVTDGVPPRVADVIAKRFAEYEALTNALQSVADAALPVGLALQAQQTTYAAQQNHALIAALNNLTKLYSGS